MKKILRPLFLSIFISMCLLTTHCGFRLNHQNQLSPHLRTLYVATDQPYDKFVTLLKRQFMQMNITLTKTHQLAPVTLKIIEAKITHSTPDITTSDKARTYNLMYRVVFSLEGRDGSPLLSDQEIVIHKKMTLNPGQTLYSNNEFKVIQHEMEREAIILLFYRLQTKQVKDILNENLSKPT